MSKKHNTVKVFLVGGGSGGHVAPLRSIASELQNTLGEGNVFTTFVCERGSKFDELMNEPYVHDKKKIVAGKFRRYHGDSVLKHLIDVKTLLFNVRDFFKFLFGCMQAVMLLALKRPDVIFLKGGFVCVPIGWGARLLRIPYVTHDSDAIPGLANKLTASGARKNLIAIKGTFPYDESKTIVTGIPVDSRFYAMNDESKKAAREELSIPLDAMVVLITGGGLGARMLNKSVITALNNLARSTDTDTTNKVMYVVHITGKTLYDETLDLYEDTQLDPDKVNVVDFTTDMPTYVAAADIIVSRAGATAIAEFAASKKASILVPGAHLTGGQQLHNAHILDDANASIIVLEQNTDGLEEAIKELATNEEARHTLEQSIAQFAVRDSSKKIVTILLDIIGYSRKPTSEKKEAVTERSMDEED